MLPARILLCTRSLLRLVFRAGDDSAEGRERHVTRVHHSERDVRPGEHPCKHSGDGGEGARPGRGSQQLHRVHTEHHGAGDRLHLLPGTSGRSLESLRASGQRGPRKLLLVGDSQRQGRPAPTNQREHSGQGSGRKRQQSCVRPQAVQRVCGGEREHWRQCASGTYTIPQTLLLPLLCDPHGTYPFNVGEGIIKAEFGNERSEVRRIEMEPGART